MTMEVPGWRSCSGGILNGNAAISWGRILLLLQVVSLALADRTFTKVYEPILGTQACFKRLNGTHEIGCRSSSAGQVGVLHLIEDQQSLQWVLNDGPHAPYICILYPEYFTREHLLQFRDSGRVNGILVLGEKKEDPSAPTKLSNFSTDSSCPNEVFSFYNGTSKSCPAWNQPGNSLLFENFDFPIFYVKNDTEAATVLKCYETFNRPVNNAPKEWPLCAGQLKSFMMAAVDTPTCLRRSSVFSINPGTSKVCDPLGDQNLWATLYPQNRTANQSQSAIILAARFDGASIFDEMSPSADSSVTGLVTLLTVLKQLSSIKDKLVLSPNSPIDNVYFMLFNGESFGYIGSSRIVYDMINGEFPLKLDEIKYYLEISQAAAFGDNDSYFIHQTDLSQSKDLTETLEKQAALNNIAMKTLDNSTWGVPPSSLHSFLRERANITGLVLTNHIQAYRNKFYNSIFDTKETIQYDYGDRSVFSLQQKLASLSATVANSVISLLQLEDIAPPEIKPDLNIVDELLHCYLVTNNCSIFRDISGFKPAGDTPTPPYPLYVGVTSYTNSLTQLTKYLLVSYLGTNVSKTKNISDEADCWKVDTPGPHYFFNETCYDCSLVNLTEAKSPAFLISGYDWSSGRYSTWSESVWQKFSVRIFLKPSLLHEVMTLVSGILVVAVSMLFMRFVDEKKDVMFPSRYAGYLPVPTD